MFIQGINKDNNTNETHKKQEYIIYIFSFLSLSEATLRFVLQGRLSPRFKHKTTRRQYSSAGGLFFSDFLHSLLSAK